MPFYRSDTEMPTDNECFVIQPYGVHGEDEFNWDRFYDHVLAPIVRDAGLVPGRADRQSGETIRDTIWQSLVRAAVVIVDVTGGNPNVMYELALAHALNKRVIIIAQDPGNLPTDIQIINVIGHEHDGMTYHNLQEKLLGRLRDVMAAAAQESMITILPQMAVRRVSATIVSRTPKHAWLRDTQDENTYYNAQAATFDWKFQNADTADFTALKWFDEGTVVNGFAYFSGGERRFTLRDPLLNPWPRMKRDLPTGREMQVEVVSVTAAGVQVNLGFGEILGFVPTQSVDPSLQNLHAQLWISIQGIDAEKRLIHLHTIEGGKGRPVVAGPVTSAAPKVAAARPPAAANAPIPAPPVGSSHTGEVTGMRPAQYAFVMLSDFPEREKAILVMRDSLGGLLDRFDRGDNLKGIKCTVEITTVDEMGRCLGKITAFS